MDVGSHVLWEYVQLFFSYFLLILYIEIVPISQYLALGFMRV